MNENKAAVVKEDEFDFKKVLSKFTSYWKLYVLSLILFIIAGVLFILYVTPLYNVHAEVLVSEDQNGNSSSSSSLLASSALSSFSGLLATPTNANNELSIIQTRDLLTKVVRDLNLNIVYYRKGFPSKELYNKSPFNVNFIPVSDSVVLTTFNISFPKLGQSPTFSISSDDLDTAFKAKFNDTIRTRIGKVYISKTGQPFEKADYSFTLNSIDYTVYTMIMNENLTAQITDPETTIITLIYTKCNVPKKGEDILNDLIDKYIERDLNTKNQISDSTISFINARINIVGAELNHIELDIQNFKQNNKIANLGEQSKLLVTNASTYYNKQNEVDVQLDVIKSMLNYIQDDKTNSRPIPSTLNNDPTFLSLVGKYNQLVLEKDKAALVTTESNPATQNLDEAIRNVRTDLVNSLQNQQKAYQTSKDQIVQQNSLMANMVNEVPVQERQFVDLSREESVKQALYQFLLQKREETAITKASNIPNSSIIQAPKSDALPYFPGKLLVFAACFLLALIVPTTYIIFKNALHKRIYSREDVTEVTNANILAEISHSDEGGNLLPIKEMGRSILIEQFRTFRTNMDFLTGQTKCSKILVTSSMAQEGKSFVSVNLAQIYAISGKKVLLMEMDLRRPRLSAMLGMSNEMGFTNYIISQKSVDDFIVPLPTVPNAFLMSSGPIPPNPAEILMSPAIDNMFEQLSNRFDVIIVDSPPIGLVTDAQILSKHVDVNLYILRQGYTLKSSLEIVNDLLDSGKFSNLYLVINDVKKGTSFKYGYGYGYGYKYGYGYGYGGNGNGNGVKKKGGLFRRKNKVSV
ncbi:MAG: GumC family protein [Chitinophagaceae bacterium]